MAERAVARIVDQRRGERDVLARCRPLFADPFPDDFHERPGHVKRTDTMDKAGYAWPPGKPVRKSRVA